MTAHTAEGRTADPQDSVPSDTRTDLLQRFAAWPRRLAQRNDRLLLCVQLLYVVAFVGVFLFGSNMWPAAPDLIVVGLLGFAIITGRSVRFLRDWTPLLALVLAYLALPGLAPGLQRRVHIGLPIDIDLWLGRGVLPTVRLQSAFWDGVHTHWYDYAAATLYLLHFLVPLVLAFVFWQRRRRLYWRFVRTYLVLMYSGFLIYLVYPAAPPWWASNAGRVPAVQPVLSLVHWHGIGNPVGLLTGTFQPDEVAAMPSMHAAFALLVALVFWRLRPRWGWLALGYPLAMGTAVIYTGDHYLIDVLAGWVLAGCVFLIVWGRDAAARPEPLRLPVEDGPIVERRAS
jgi:membrane-associated phospholipid phosphatase